MASHQVSSPTTQPSPSTPSTSYHGQTEQVEPLVAGKGDASQLRKRKSLSEQKITESSDVSPTKKQRSSWSEIDKHLTSLETDVGSDTWQLLKALSETIRNPDEKYLFLTGEIEASASFIDLAKRILGEEQEESLDAHVHTETLQPASQFLDHLFEALPGIEWKELWQYIPETSRIKDKITYKAPEFMTSTTVNKIKLTAIYNAYYNFINSDKKKSIDLLKQTKHDCHNRLCILADDLHNNLHTELPKLSPTQRHLFIEWLDSVSHLTKDENLKWRNMSKRPERAILTCKKLEKKLSKIHERTELDYKFKYDADSIMSILGDAHAAHVSVKEISRFLERKQLETTTSTAMIDQCLKACTDIIHSLTNFYHYMNIPIESIPKITPDNEDRYPNNDAAPYTACHCIIAGQPKTLYKNLKRLVEKNPSLPAQ